MKYSFSILFFILLSYSLNAQLPKVLQDDIDQSYDWLLSVAKSKTCQTAKPLTEADIDETKVEDCDFVHEFKMFPVPVTDNLSIAFKAHQKPTKIIITSFESNVVLDMELNDFNGAFNDIINLKTVIPGTYLLTIIQGQKAFIRKLIKQ